jgi:hypothetical protein
MGSTSYNGFSKTETVRRYSNIQVRIGVDMCRAVSDALKKMSASSPLKLMTSIAGCQQSS